MTKDTNVNDNITTHNILSTQYEQVAERGERSEAREATHQRHTHQQPQ